MGGLGGSGRDVTMRDLATGGTSLVSLLRCSIRDLSGASEGAGDVTTVGVPP